MSRGSVLFNWKTKLNCLVARFYLNSYIDRYITDVWLKTYIWSVVEINPEQNRAGDAPFSPTGRRYHTVTVWMITQLMMWGQRKRCKYNRINTGLTFIYKKEIYKDRCSQKHCSYLKKKTWKLEFRIRMGDTQVKTWQPGGWRRWSQEAPQRLLSET